MHAPHQYWLRTPIEIFSSTQVVTKTYSFCPMVCTLYEWNWQTRQIEGPYPTEIINTWNPATGAFTIGTNDKSLHNARLFL